MKPDSAASQWLRHGTPCYRSHGQCPVLPYSIGGSQRPVELTPSSFLRCRRLTSVYRFRRNNRPPVDRFPPCPGRQRKPRTLNRVRADLRISCSSHLPPTHPRSALRLFLCRYRKTTSERTQTSPSS